jgi:hypothetical protein
MKICISPVTRSLLGLLLIVGLSVGGCQVKPQSGDENIPPAVVGSTALKVVGFNVESGGANPEFLAKNYISPMQGVDVWGFSEVEDRSWADTFVAATAMGESGQFNSILGTTGGADRLLIIYNGDRLELVRHFELAEVNIEGKVRAPLVAQFRLKSNQREFLFMVNHLYRSNSKARHEQAQRLNEWAKTQNLPIITVGDYNFDWTVSGKPKHDKGYDYLTANDVFAWVQPQNLLPTHCNTKYKSVLDFVFVSGAAKNWSPSSEILFPEASYCPDTAQKSDHRPIAATFTVK